jgi:hypothetical protein
MKEHALNYQEHRYEISIIYDSLYRVITQKQNENESLVDYTKRFKKARDVLESHIGGPIELTKFMKLMTDYDDTDAKKVVLCKKKAFQELMAFVYLMSSNPEKYGSFLTGLQTQQSLGNNQYPLIWVLATITLRCGH